MLDLDKLLIALKKIQAGERGEDLAICGNLINLGIDLGAQTYDFLLSVFKKWPEFSGDPPYPVPHPYLGAAQAYCQSANLWEGEYGAARIRLLEFCIEYIESEIKEKEIKK